MAPVAHSDLEVVHPPDGDTHKYPHFSAYSSDPIPAYDYPDVVPNAGKETYESAAHYGLPPYQPLVQQKTICGLHKRTFWILSGVAAVVIVAAVGGGVGGALASRSSDKASSISGPTPTSISTAHPSLTDPSSNLLTTSSASAQAITTTTLVGPSNSPQPTLYRDCPSSNNSVYTVAYGSTSYQFRKICNAGFLNVNNWVSPVQAVVASLDDCIDRCAAYDQSNGTAIQGGRIPICNAVCWRNTFDEANDWEGGHCFGFATQNSTVDGATSFIIGNVGQNAICDSAALINQQY